MKRCTCLSTPAGTLAIDAPRASGIPPGAFLCYHRLGKREGRAVRGLIIASCLVLAGCATHQTWMKADGSVATPQQR